MIQLENSRPKYAFWSSYARVKSLLRDLISDETAPPEISGGLINSSTETTHKPHVLLNECNLELFAGGKHILVCLTACWTSNILDS